MTTVPESSEKAPHKAPDNEVLAKMLAGWESLEAYPDRSIKTKVEFESNKTHSPFEKVEAINGSSLVDGRVFFRDAVKLAQLTMQTNPETLDEDQKLLLNFGGVYVLVGKDSDPKQLEQAWARAMRGHCNQQITVAENDTPEAAIEHPLVTQTLDNIPQEILEAEAQEDEKKRLAGDEQIERADAIINMEETYKKLKEEVWDVKLTLYGGEKTDNVYGDRENQPEERQFESVSDARVSMSRTYAILWAKLMQARLNESKNVAIADVAEETLNRMGITIPKERTGESDPLVTYMIFELGSEFVFDWEHSEALGKWFNERHRPQPLESDRFQD